MTMLTQMDYSHLRLSCLPLIIRSHQSKQHAVVCELALLVACSSNTQEDFLNPTDDELSIFTWQSNAVMSTGAANWGPEGRVTLLQLLLHPLTSPKGLVIKFSQTDKTDKLTRVSQSSAVILFFRREAIKLQSGRYKQTRHPWPQQPWEGRWYGKLGGQMVTDRNRDVCFHSRKCKLNNNCFLIECI